MRFREKLYGGFCRTVLRPGVLARLSSPDRVEEGRRQWFEPALRLRPKAAPRIWWHAASVGELENLWPVILQYSGKSRTESAVTVFSESARGALVKLQKEVARQGQSFCFAGYSPWEGFWGAALAALQPDLFVTSKYEAWPELWLSLSAAGIPLVIVGAQKRRSLEICARICGLLGSPLPAMTLLVADDRDEEPLRRQFPEADVKRVGDARWDQVFARARAGSEKVCNLRESLLEVPNPAQSARKLGVLGSVWPADLELWERFFSEIPEIQDTIIAVPHRIEEPAPSGWIQTSALKTPLELSQAIQGQHGPIRIWVDEMGFLSELYSIADWAYVGGGFGAGVHSRIEPAIHGIPITCGPVRAEAFTETSQLRESGQLTLVHDAGELKRWWQGASRAIDESRSLWKKQALDRRGATMRIQEVLDRILDSRSSALRVNFDDRGKAL